MKRIKLSIVSLTLSIATVLGFPLSTLAATDYSLFGDATTVSPGHNSATAVQTTSDAAPGWGGINFDVASGTTFADLATLSTDFNVTDDNCGGGSPRFQLATPSGNISVYLGNAPGYDACQPNTWVNTGDLLEGSLFVDTSQIGGTFYDTYANALANYGAMPIESIQLVVDSGWNASASGGDGEQTVLFDNVVVGGTTYTFESVVVNAPTNKDECKKDGWKSFGTMFKNQGDCVSFVASTGKSQPSGLATY